MSGRQWHGAVSMMTREMWKKRRRARLLVFHFKRNVSAVPARQEEEYGDSVLASYRFLFCFLPPNNHEYRRNRNRSRLLPLPGFSHFPMESLLLLLPPFLKRDINFAFRSLSLSLSSAITLFGRRVSFPLRKEVTLSVHVCRIRLIPFVSRVAAARGCLKMRTWGARETHSTSNPLQSLSFVSICRKLRSSKRTRKPKKKKKSSVDRSKEKRGRRGRRSRFFRITERWKKGGKKEERYH